jgi:uncharacterized UBP type Zn finger protein
MAQGQVDDADEEEEGLNESHRTEDDEHHHLHQHHDTTTIISTELQEQLMMMGFPEDWCAMALRENDNDIISASSWIVDNLDILAGLTDIAKPSGEEGDNGMHAESQEHESLPLEDDGQAQHQGSEAVNDHQTDNLDDGATGDVSKESIEMSS